MNTKLVQTILLDPYNLSLGGQKLIEASAGTGKTYTIALLYLRLLLGIGKKNAFYRPLNVKEILIVTFTKVGITELKSRIYYNINQMRLACIRNGIGFDKNSIFKILLSYISNKNKAIKLLLDAEIQIDEASIYTIHGFCYHILINNAFESGILFNQTIIKNENNIQKQACNDFWRRNCYPLNYSISKIIINEWNNPEALLNEIKPYLQGDIPFFIKNNIKSQSIKQRHKFLINIIQNIKKLWLLNSSDIINLIKNSFINKRSYNLRNLSIWISTINVWAKSKTIDYIIPKELNRFKQSELINKTPFGQFPKHEIFINIDNLMKESFTLRDIFIKKAIIDIRKIIIKEKKEREEIGFDDLLNFLDKSLHKKGGKELSNKIRNNYPFAIIDEFQDTNFQQYRIFQYIYHKYDNCGLILIGDPKQAIYSFRGADIFSYFKIRNKIKLCYNLNINWRSSSNMVMAINTLFTQVSKPFLFKQIYFNKIKSPSLNKNLAFFHKKIKLPALNFYYLNVKFTSIIEYQEMMAAQFAIQIYNWLIDSENGTTWLYYNNVKKLIKASDIVILVRNYNEAKIIKEALNKINISSVFLSNRESIFTTNEARDLLWLLQAIISPKNDIILRRALATNLIGLTAQYIEYLNKNKDEWNLLVKNFLNYSLTWQQYGILPVLKVIMVNYNITEKLLLDNINGKRRLANIMHLSELLQENELYFVNKHALIRWLDQQINNNDNLIENHQIRLKSNNNLIKISTIHKAKGLEYPIVCLPFACQFSQKKIFNFHNRNNLNNYLDLTQQIKNIKLADEERLSEDLRILYVALTRSKYHCSIGVAPIVKNFSNIKDNNTNLHKSALGYLLQNGQSGNINLLYKSLNKISNQNISVTPIDSINLSLWYLNKKKITKLSVSKIKREIQSNWKITSYSKLIYYNKYLLYNKITNNTKNIEIIIKDLVPKIDINTNLDILLTEKENINKNSHTFPKGTLSGIFLHSLLELLSFNKYPEESLLIKELDKVGFSINWAPMLKIWLINIFNTPLLNDNFSLSKITSKYQLNEMEFYLPIEKILFSSTLNNLIKQYDPLSKRCINLNFDPVMGILKGCIDLIFYWKNKFYLLDYKSNWLGENDLSYNYNSIENAMIINRYDLQYQLYTLAIHRYLRNRVSNYNYQKHFGGIIYLFLRGINIKKTNYSIYHTIPTYAFIDSLDKLFSVTN